MGVRKSESEVGVRKSIYLICDMEVRKSESEVGVRKSENK